MTAVGVTAQEIVREVRRQFRESAGRIMSGEQRPDYQRCVSEADELHNSVIAPGSCAITLLTQLPVGDVLVATGPDRYGGLPGSDAKAWSASCDRAHGVWHFLQARRRTPRPADWSEGCGRLPHVRHGYRRPHGSIPEQCWWRVGQCQEVSVWPSTHALQHKCFTGQSYPFAMCRYIEDEHFGGKGGEAHKASITGDTVGDPCKVRISLPWLTLSTTFVVSDRSWMVPLQDTAGPSIHVLIKLLSTVTLVCAPIYIAV